MVQSKKLYPKNYRSLYAILKESKNPMMLLRWLNHFFLFLAVQPHFLRSDLCNHEEFLFIDFKNKILSLLESYNKIHPEHMIGFYETFRSNKRQAFLFQSGVTKKLKYGMHYFGIAVDLVRFQFNKPQWTLDYDLLIKNGVSIGLTNLTPYEQCHFQFIPVNMQNDFITFAKHSICCIQDLLNCKVDGDLGPITQGQIIINSERLSVYFSDLEKELKVDE